MDARSLLRAKKAEARMEHPYASYTARGELRCSACAVPVKQWDAHLLTKQHRTSAAREKANQAAAAKKAASAASAAGPSKRGIAATGDGEGEAGPSAKRAKSGPAGLPQGFFSKGNAPVEDDDDEDEEENGAEGTAGPSTSSAEIPASAATPKATGDNELDDFLASLSAPAVDADPNPESAGEYAISKPTQSTKKSTVPKYKEVEPGQASYEAAPVRNAPAEEKNEEEKEAEPEESEKDKRERLAREEKEDIVRRLEEEERAQEDADSRVTSLKERMALLKKRREARGGAAAGATKGKGKAAVNGSKHA